MTVLIADSGSTHTNWCLLHQNRKVLEFATPGINPFMQESQSISNVLMSETSHFEIPKLDFIWFYGAGCINDEKKDIVHQGLIPIFGDCKMEIESDLLAAARGLCQKNEGIACIIGTGSNSCYYDGTVIHENVSPLGFILGDEGSGAVLGRKLIGNILKRQLPIDVINDFSKVYEFTSAEILENVYRKPYPNRFLAQFTTFIHDHLNIPEVYQMVMDEFILFLQRNVMQYKAHQRLPIHFTGSVAHFFSKPLSEAVQKCQLTTGKIIRSPLEGLIQYHLNI